MQTTLLGLAIAFILALTAALIGPYFIDWNQFRPQFEAEASRIVGTPVHVGGTLEARLLPAPSLRLRSVVIGGVTDAGKARADKLDVEFSLSSLMRGEWRATELTINGAALDLGLDPQGRIDLPTPSGRFNLGSLAIDRLNLTGRLILHDAARRTLELNDIAFSGDVRSLAGSLRGDGNFMLSGSRYPFRVSSGETPDKTGTRVHLTIDPGDRPLSVDLDGVLAFEARAPRFDGAIILGSPIGKAKTTDDRQPTPWRLSAKLKADPGAARLEQIEASFGTDESGPKLAGLADIRFGASPLLHAVLSARHVDADRMFAKDGDAKQPAPLLPALRKLVAALPQLPIASQIEFGAEQIIFGGRPVLNVDADLRNDTAAWSVARLNFRAPGATRVVLGNDAATPAGGIRGTLDIDSGDPDALAAWLQGRSELTFRNQKPLRLRGDLSATSDRVAIDALKMDIDGSSVEGRAAWSDPPGGTGARLDADLKADKLDLDAVAALGRSLGMTQASWPNEAQLSITIGRATSAGQEMRAFMAQFGYGPKTISLDQIRIGDANGLMLDGGGAFDRIDATGRLALNATSPSLGQMSGLLAPLAPAVAARLNAVTPGAGKVNAKLAIDLSRDANDADRASVHGVLNFDSPQVSGVTTMTATPSMAAVRGMDINALSRSDITASSRLSAPRGSHLLALLGLDHIVAATETPLGFEGSATGAWRAPLRGTARLSGGDMAADAEGSVDFGDSQPKAAITLAVRTANLAPLFDLKPSDALVRNVSLTSRVTLLGGKLDFDDVDSTVAGSRLRGHLAFTPGEKAIDGRIGIDTIDLASAFGLAIGTRGRNATEPLGRGLLAGWHGQLAVEALRGFLPGGPELRPVSGVIKSDGQSFGITAFRGGIGGGEATADIDAKPTPDGFALNARVQLSDVDGTALRYRSLAMPAGRTSLRMTLASDGRSASALEGALSGNGLVTIDGARITGLDPQAFDVALREGDSGRPIDDVRLRQIVEPALSAGALSVASAQIPFSIKDGRLRVGSTTLDAEAARAIVSGGYDIAADQTDLRVSLISTATASAITRPEIQLFAVGSPDRLDRTVDVAALSSWLAVRAIDRETQRLDLLERRSVPAAVPASLPPAASSTLPVLPALPAVEAPREPPVAQPSGPPISTDVPVPGRNPRRIPMRPNLTRPNLPRPATAPQTSNGPVIGQQVSPLPAPIEIRPAPGAARAPRPRLAPPLVLTPPAITPRS